MSKFELSVSKNYVNDWKTQDGLRELVQNALDEQNREDGNTATINYDPDKKELRISNKKSILKPNTLLLGKTTKEGDDRAIGQFGEGYKLGMLVLIREGYKVKIENFALKQEWNVRFVKSRRYDGEEILTVETKSHVFKGNRHDNLTFVITGIEQNHYDQLINNVLQLKGVYNNKENFDQAHTGNVLFQSKEKGRLYVNGLYITNLEEFEYGYDIKSEFVSIGRDRNLVDDYNISSATTAMWAELLRKNDKYQSTVMNLLDKKVPDTCYNLDLLSLNISDGENNNTSNYSSLFYSFSKKEEDVNYLALSYYNQLKKEYGDDVLFISNENKVAKEIGHKNVVNLHYRQFNKITGLDEYKEKFSHIQESLQLKREIKPLNECMDDLKNYIDEVEVYLPSQYIFKFKMIYSDFENAIEAEKLNNRETEADTDTDTDNK